uniref:Biotin/lipoyl-binding protein n=1 Tax=Archaeoglobus fulgidus TaxID=2234 RepID=A0A7J3M146_ARCFL
MIYKVEFQGRVYEVEVEDVGANVFKVRINGKTAILEVKPKLEVKSTVGETTTVKKVEKVKVAKVEGRVISAPMNGTVMQILVKPGDEVKEGDIVAVIEAMKMENPIKAMMSGKVVEILVKVGDKVAKEAPLIKLG